MADATPYLLDTNILVAYVRAGTVGQAIENTYHLRERAFKPLVSVVSIGEAMSLARQFKWGNKKRLDLAELLRELVWVDINSQDVFDAYAEIDFISKISGNPMAKNDVWIAATSKVADATLLTTDSDFDHLEGKYISRIKIDPQTGKSM